MSLLLSVLASRFLGTVLATVENLVHTTAPSAAADDARYRALAQASLFESKRLADEFRSPFPPKALESKITTQH